MKCPKCKRNIKVQNTFVAPDNQGFSKIQRRYICDDCKIKFSTNEIIAKESITTIENSYEECFQTKVYNDLDCEKCPHRKECYD